MRFMLMMNTPGGGPYQIAKWPQKDIAAHIQFMKTFAAKLRESGELVGAEGLAGPDQAKRVRAGDDGQPITDGVFPESKEFLAGYWIIDVEGPERAYALAAEASTAPGKGGHPMNLSIEDLLAQTKLFVHGSTVVDNIVLTRDGSKVGLITYSPGLSVVLTSSPSISWISVIDPSMHTTTSAPAGCISHPPQSSVKRKHDTSRPASPSSAWRVP